VIDKKERRRFGVLKMSEDKKRTRKPPKRRNSNPFPGRKSNWRKRNRSLIKW